MKEKKIQNNVVLDGIRHALQNQITWQHYAEAKNLCLLTVSAGTLALLFSSMQNITAQETLEIYLDRIFFENGWGLFFYIFCTFVSLIIAIFSFILLPKVDENLNLENCYFISWRYIKANEKNKELYNKLLEYDEEAQIKDAFLQQRLGSKVTYRKYKLFNFGVVIYLLGLLLGLINLFFKHIYN